MSKQPEETSLKKIYDRLYEQKKVKNQNDFADQIKYHPTPVSMMLSGVKPMPYKFLVSIYKKFNVNINFIISNGVGNMFLSDTEMVTRRDIEAANALRERNTALENENQDLRQRIVDKDKIIKLLEKDRPE